MIAAFALVHRETFAQKCHRHTASKLNLPNGKNQLPGAPALLGPGTLTE